MTHEEVRELALSQHHDMEDMADGLFRLLVDVADAYVRELEDIASDDPAPFLGGTTPLTAAMNGLVENLEMRRSNDWQNI